VLIERTPNEGKITLFVLAARADEIVAGSFPRARIAIAARDLTSFLRPPITRAALLNAGLSAWASGWSIHISTLILQAPSRRAARAVGNPRVTGVLWSGAPVVQKSVRPSVILPVMVDRGAFVFALALVSGATNASFLPTS
jgi:hypothetical protein